MGHRMGESILTLTDTADLDRLPVPQAVAKRIQDMIRTGVYAAEERLPPQRELAKELGVSRASVREALLSLETLGLIRTLPARGTFVTGARQGQAVQAVPTPGQGGFSLSDIFATRAVIEAELAAKAAQNITPAELSKLKEFHSDFRNLWEIGDLVGHVNADLQFHLGIAQASPNALLRATYTSLAERLTESQRRPIPSTDNARMMQSIAEHDALIAALERHDAEAARAAMHAHIYATARCAGVDL